MNIQYKALKKVKAKASVPIKCEILKPESVAIETVNKTFIVYSSQCAIVIKNKFQNLSNMFLNVLT